MYIDKLEMNTQSAPHGTQTTDLYINIVITSYKTQQFIHTIKSVISYPGYPTLKVDIILITVQ